MAGDTMTMSIEQKQIKISKVNGVTIANLTAHDITLVFNDNQLHNVTVNVPCSGYVLRVQEREKIVGEIGGIKIIEKEYTGVTDDDLKAVKELINEVDVIIVSKLAGKYLNEQKVNKKIYFIGSTVKDDKGRPMGANALSPISVL